MTTSTTDEAWIDDFMLALRLRSVRGDAIGDAVATVREHLADSGEGATEAFGEPRSYAASLELPRVAAPRASDPAIMGIAVSLLALFAFAPAVNAIAAGERLEFSLPQLLLFLVPVAAVLGLPAYFNLALRHLWVLAVAFGLAVLSATGAALFAPERGYPVLASWDPWWVAAISGAILLGASTWSIVAALRDEPDVIVDPKGSGPAPVPRSHRLATVVPHLLLPAAALACIAGEAVLG